MSCDLLPTMQAGEHYLGNVLDIIYDGWDLMIAFPPCTHLTVSGARSFAEKRADGRQHGAIEFVKTLLDAPINRIALENPVGILSTHIRKPDQLIEPYWFGDPIKKRTCLWLKNLPDLEPTNVIPDHLVLTRRRDWYDKYPPYVGLPLDVDRATHRGLTFPGIAVAMAEQWG